MTINKVICLQNKGSALGILDNQRGLHGKFARWGRHMRTLDNQRALGEWQKSCTTLIPYTEKLLHVGFLRATRSAPATVHNSRKPYSSRAPGMR